MAMGRVVVLAGASGLVGAQLADALLAHPGVARVVVRVRRPLAREHAKLEQRVVDFARLSADDIAKDAEDAYCALGTTMKKAGSREAFRAVDHDAVLAFAKACRAQGVRRFLLVSAQGADPRAVSFYMRVKGETEADVRALGFDVMHVARPGFLDGARTEVRPGELFGIAVTRAIGAVAPSWKWAPVHVEAVAGALVRLAFTDVRGAHVHDSLALKDLAARPMP